MGTAVPQQRLAFDSNFVVGIGEGDETCLSCLEELKARKPEPAFFITPTVVVEILAIIKDTTKPRQLRKAAEAGFRSLSGHGFKIIQLDSTQESVAKNIGDELRYAGLIPYGEINDARIIGEAAVDGCNFLVSDDGDITATEQEKVRAILADKHVSEIRILRPHQIVRALGKK